MRSTGAGQNYRGTRRARSGMHECIALVTGNYEQYVAQDTPPRKQRMEVGTDFVVALEVPFLYPF